MEQRQKASRCDCQYAALCMLTEMSFGGEDGGMDETEQRGRPWPLRKSWPPWPPPSEKGGQRAAAKGDKMPPQSTGAAAVQASVNSSENRLRGPHACTACPSMYPCCDSASWIGLVCMASLTALTNARCPCPPPQLQANQGMVSRLTNTDRKNRSDTAKRGHSTHNRALKARACFSGFSATGRRVRHTSPAGDPRCSARPPSQSRLSACCSQTATRAGAGAI